MENWSLVFHSKPYALILQYQLLRKVLKMYITHIRSLPETKYHFYQYIYLLAKSQGRGRKEYQPKWFVLFLCSTSLLHWTSSSRERKYWNCPITALQLPNLLSSNYFPYSKICSETSDLDAKFICYGGSVPPNKSKWSISRSHSH